MAQRADLEMTVPEREDGICLLSQAGSIAASELGGKAASLSELSAAGYPVPDGVVLLASFVASADEDALRATAAFVDQRFTSRPVAVRSSAMAEDTAEASFAGMYATELNVSGVDEITNAIVAVRESANSARVQTYGDESSADLAGNRIAILIQPMIDADIAGVAFSANPITGDRQTALVSAVVGLGESLVSGESISEDWTVGPDGISCTNGTGEIANGAIEGIAKLARRLADSGQPVDIEWAVKDDRLWLLQCRPITALPEQVQWQVESKTAAKAPFWRRDFRFGEWCSEPVTPLFTSWYLPASDQGFIESQRTHLGGSMDAPFNIVVNGWLYSSIGCPGFGALKAVLRHPVFTAKWVIAFRTFKSNPVRSERWTAQPIVEVFRDDILPNYMQTVAKAEAIVESADSQQLVDIVDEVAAKSGEMMLPVVEGAGFGWKSEMALATFFAKHLAQSVDFNYQLLLAGLDISTQSAAHAVATLDWIKPTLGESGIEATKSLRSSELQATRTNAETLCRQALANNPKLRADFNDRLRIAQQYAVVREEIVGQLTLGWPVMRRALLRLGEDFTKRGVIDEPDDVFWMNRTEVTAALADQPLTLAPEISTRKMQWQRQNKLMPPIGLGKPSKAFERRHIFDVYVERQEATANSDISGVPASPGVVSGPVRVIRRPDEFASNEPGDILVAPGTNPAWTPLFASAAAVVTDGGSVLAHASLIAREYGIPAVVATQDATRRLRTGDIVRVDGNRGIVEMRSETTRSTHA